MTFQRYPLLALSVVALVLAACGPAPKIESNTEPTPATSATTSTLSPGPPAKSSSAEADHLMRFLNAYNAGDVAAAIAQFSRTATIGFSDCNYQTQQVVTGRGRTEIMNWLRAMAAEDDRLTLDRINYPKDDQPVLGVSFLNRNSLVITRAGHPNGITPKLAAKVKFDSTKLIIAFANGPGGGTSGACRLP